MSLVLVRLSEHDPVNALPLGRKCSCFIVALNGVKNLLPACALKSGIVSLVSLLMPLQSLGFCLDCRLAQNCILNE